MSLLSNKRGIVNEVMIVILVFIALVTLVLVFWGVGTLGPIAVGQSQMLATEIGDAFQTNSPNSSLANASVVPVQTAQMFLGLVEGIVYLCFIGSFLGFLAVCYYVRTYKWLSMAWVCLVIGAVLVAMIVSNSYQDTYSSSTDLSSLYSQWGTNDFLLRYLPIITGIIGFIGGIILFAIQATGGEEDTEEIR